MAETTEFVSTIRVKDLVSAFESKSDQVRVEFTRPRARSVGNILAKNVVVRQNEFNTLEDIEKALKKLDTSLNFYEVYNKEKHVAFQEQLFNILTSIVNIEDHGEDASSRKKQLISKTQTLVSFLNQKLPSNVNQLIKPTNNYKYTPYSPRIVENVEDAGKRFAIYSENTKSVDITDSGEDVFVSVRKLKENFQSKIETSTDKPPKSDKKVRAVPVTNGDLEEPVTKERIEEIPEVVSVSKLRNLFEEKSEETSKGLGIITDEKPQQIKVLHSSNVNIPYTERNLGSVRLQRSVSGNYMNYTGLLKRVDISKSTSELNRDFPEKTDEKNDKAASSDESDAESVESADTVEERKSVQDLMKIYLQQSADNTDFKRAKSTPNVNNKDKVSISDTPEEVKVRYSTTVTVNNATQPANTFLVKSETNKQEPKEVEVKYSTIITDDAKENRSTNKLATVEGSEEEINYLSTASTTITTKENVATLNGAVEEITFSTSTSDDLKEESKKQEQAITLDSTEENVKYLKPESDKTSTNEEVATTNGTTEEDDTTSSTITPGEAANTTEADISGLEEEEVEYSTAGTENVAQETVENAIVSVSKDQAKVTDSLPTTLGSEGLDKELEDSIIEEEIGKIDVEQTLADQEIILDEEELKNADNEFEKILENSAANESVA